MKDDKRCVNCGEAAKELNEKVLFCHKCRERLIKAQKEKV